MLNILRSLLLQFIDDIDSGNSNISEEQQGELIDLISRLNSKELSKTEAADYIGVCKATFDNYINKGLIPEGKKRQGINALVWKKYDLDKYLKNNTK